MKMQVSYDIVHPCLWIRQCLSNPYPLYQIKQSPFIDGCGGTWAPVPLLKVSAHKQGISGLSASIALASPLPWCILSSMPVLHWQALHLNHLYISSPPSSPTSYYTLSPAHVSFSAQRWSEASFLTLVNLQLVTEWLPPVHQSTSIHECVY